MIILQTQNIVLFHFLKWFFRSMNLQLFSTKLWGAFVLLFWQTAINLSFPWFPWLGWLLCTSDKMFGGCWLSILSGCHLINPSNKCLTFVWLCFSCGNAQFPDGGINKVQSCLILSYLILSQNFNFPSLNQGNSGKSSVLGIQLLNKWLLVRFTIN